jgi:hypothetical protein
MDQLSPHKSFTDPDNVRGLPQVLKSTPVPRRESPLPGTKTMLCPKDAHLLERVASQPDGAIKPPLAATFMGAVAMAVALGSNFLWWRFMRSDGYDGWQDKWLLFPGFVIVHLLWLFSRVLSNGGTRLGGLAVAVLYLGPLMLLVIDHFVR